jgi:glycosyltransferase involved in cell wall biosynthesis
MDKVSITVLIPIKNEIANLSRCISSVSWASEIVVVDSHSTDGSVELAQSLGAKVIQFDYSPPWPKKKNWALENVLFANDWIFILDADEVLPPEAQAEIDRIISASDSPHNGYWINRRFMFMQKWLKHSYYPNWNLRLFKHKVGRFEQLTDLETNSGDNEVHEHVKVTGSTGRLQCEMDHYAFPTVEVFVEKHNRYSNWEARVATAPPGSKIDNKDVSFRRRLKTLAKNLPCRPLLRFLYVYVWQKGFLDGLEGYYFARLHAFYEFLTVAKTYELRKLSKKG